MLLALILAATPPCESIWPQVWTAYSQRELSKGTPPLFEKFPDAKQRLEKAWLVECRKFDKATLECAKGSSPLDCKEVDRSLDRAGAAAAAAVPRSDECMGADLESGKCQCAHSRCMDICCPEGWACAHSGAKQSKCVKP